MLLATKEEILKILSDCIHVKHGCTKQFNKTDYFLKDKSGKAGKPKLSFENSSHILADTSWLRRNFNLHQL